MANNYSFRDYLQSGSNRNNTTNVNVVGMSRYALSGIMDALDEQAHLINSLIKGVSESEAEAARRAREEAAARRRAEEEARNQFKTEQSGEKSSQVRSIANERRQRAANAAVNGKINKGLSLISILQDTLLGALSKLINIVGDGFKRSLKSFSDLSKTMRQEKLTSEQRNNIGTAAKSSVIGAKDTYGVNVSNRTANEALTALIQKGLVSNINQMSQAVRDGYVAMVASGVDAQEAYAKATTLSTNQLRKELLSRSDAMVRGVITDLNSRITDVEKLNMFGSADKASQQILETANGFAKTVGGFMSNESMADLGKIFLDFKTGNFAGMNEDAVKSALAVFGADINNIGSLTAEQLGENISKKLQEAGNDKAKLEELSRNLYILQKGQVGDGKILDELARGAMMAQKDKNSLGRNIRTDAQNAQALADNTEEGKLFQSIDNIVSGIDGFTGGLLTQISNGLDEYFGDALTLEDIVSSGFKLVSSLLAALLLSDVVKGGFEKIKGAILGALSLAGIGNGVSAATTAAGAAAGTAAGAAGTAAGAAGTAGSNAAKASKLGSLKNFAKSGVGKALSGAGKLGGSALAIAGAGLAAYDLYDAITYNPEYISTDLNTKAAKEEEKRLQKEIKTNKIAGAAMGAAAVASGFAGAKLGATIGAIGGPIGMAAGAAIGGVLGGSIGAITNHFVEASNNLKDTEIKVKSLEDLDNQIKKLDDQITKVTDEGIKQQLIALRENTAAQREVVRKQLNEKESAHWANMTGGTTDQSVIDSIRQTMVDSGNEYNKLKDTLSKLKTEEARLKSEEARLRAEGKTQEADNAQGALEVIANQITAKTVEMDEARQNELNARLALEKGITKNLVEEYGSSNVQDILQLVREDMGNQSWMHTQGDYEKHILDRLMGQLSEGVGGNELYDHIAKLSDSQKIAFLTERAKSAGMQDQQMIDEFIKKAVEASANDVGDKEMYAKFLKYFEATQNLSEAQLKEQQKANDIAQQPNPVLGLAYGGVFNSLTPAVVGEAGKEAVIPLERPDAMRQVLSDLSSSEKLALLKALLGKRQKITWDLIGNTLASVLGIGSNSAPSNQNILDSLPKDGVPGDDPATLNRILGFAGPYAGVVYQRLLHGWKGNVKDGFKQRKKWYDEAIANAANQEGRELIRGTYAERALDYGLSELGKPYILRSLGKIGYVCNELVNACIQASGFNMGKFRVHGVKATFANIQKGKYSGNEYPNFRIRNDLTPQTAIPGMVFFQDSRKNREGGFQPGHIGLVYYGHQKLHASGGSSDYTKEGFLPNWQTPCRGVTVTPFDGSNYVIGEFPGLFEQVSGNYKSNNDSSIPFGPTLTATSGSEIKNYSSSFSSSVNSAVSSVKKAGLLSDDELNELAKEAGLQNASAMTEFIKQAELLLNSNKDRDSIVAILLDIAKYLRGAVTPSKQQMVSVARPAASIYG